MQFSTEIIKILDDLSKRLGVAIDWSNENIIPYLNDLVERFILWEIVTSIFWIAFGAVFIVIGICGLTYIWKHRSNYRYFGDLDEGVTWGCVGSVASLMLGVIVVLFNCESLFEAIYLPEIAIYDYVKNLTNW